MRLKIPGYHDAYADEFGVIYNGKGAVRRAWNEKTHSYKVTSVKEEGGVFRNVKVHQLVCLAFHGERPRKMAIVRHLDGNPQNNHKDNLKWGTTQENHQDSVLHGTFVLPKFGKEAGHRRVLNSKGYRFIKKDNLWRASIRLKNKTVSLGTYKTEIEAKAARSAGVSMYLKAIIPLLEKP